MKQSPSSTTPASSAQVSSGERIVKLALVIDAYQPIDLAHIRAKLPAEYGYEKSGDARADKRAEDASRRKFERDKATLEGYGLFIDVDADSKYRLDREKTFAADVALEDDEASLLRLLGAALLDDPSYPFGDEMRMVFVKLADTLDLPDLYMATASAPQAPGAGRSGKRTGADTASKISQALQRRKRLTFGYKDAMGKQSEREVEPMGCVLFSKHLYLVAFDPAVQGERLFRYDRMSGARVNAAKPKSPDFEPRPFEPRDYLKLPFQFGEAVQEVQVRFDADHAWLADQLRMGRGTLAPADDGVIWQVEAADLERLAAWCVENGPGIAPVAPRAAIEAYASGLRRTLATLDAQEGGHHAG